MTNDTQTKLTDSQQKMLAALKTGFKLYRYGLLEAGGFADYDALAKELNPLIDAGLVLRQWDGDTYTYIATPAGKEMVRKQNRRPFFLKWLE